MPHLSSKIIQMSGPLILASVPLFLHILDKIIERTNIMGRNFLREKMKVGISFIKSVAENKDLYEPLEAYFTYEKDIHFVLTVTLFSVVSIIFAHFETAARWFEVDFFAFAAVVAALLYAFVFMRAVASSTLDPTGVERKTLKWVYGAFAVLALVVCVEVYLKISEAAHETPDHAAAQPGEARRP